MSTHYWPTTQPAQELPPIDWQPVPLPRLNRIPVADVTELPADGGWQQWCLAVQLMESAQ